MAKGLDRLNPKPKPKNNEAEGSVNLRVNPPQVKVGSPQVRVDVPAPQLNMDTKEFAAAIRGLGSAIAAIADQQTQILQTMQQQQALLTELVRKDAPTVNVPQPTVKMAPRPRSFRVELEKEGGETVGMYIEAESPN